MSINMLKKACFLVPSFDYAPDKLIKPGQIISGLKTPYKPIAKPLEPLEIHQSFQDNWEIERRRNLSGSVGIWAKFLAVILGIGGNVAANVEREDGFIWKFKKLETYFIVPDQDYIEASMRTDEVNQFFAQNPNKPAYMITGVKIARGAEVVNFKKRLFGGDGKIGSDGTGISLLLHAGPRASIAREITETESFTGSSDFVFAYRLIKIYKHHKTGVISSKEEVKGALFAHESLNSETQKSFDGSTPGISVAKEEATELVIGGFGKKDIGLRNTLHEFKKCTVRDEEDGENCEVIYLEGLET